MPAPTVQCSVCGQTVNKRQTVSIGSKRVCRTHPEANQSTVAQHERKIQDEKGRKRKPFRSHFPEPKLVPTCTNCGREGLRQDEWYYTMMLLREKYELVHGVKLPWLVFPETDVSHLKKALAPLSKMACLWVVKYDPQKHVFLTPQKRMFVEMVGIYLLCDKCCTTFKVEKNLPELPSNKDTLGALMVAGEIIHETIHQQAKKELINDN